MGRPDGLPLPLAGDDRGRASSIRRFEALLARLKDQRRSIVWTVHNVLPHDQADIETAVRVRRAIVEAADLIHIMNERTPELVEPHFSLAGKRVFYSPHPSYLGDHPRTVTRDAARFELGLRPETTVFLCFGAIQPYKGIEELIAAAEELARDRPDLDWALVVAGIAKNEELVRRIRQVEALDRRLLFYPHKVPVEDVQYFFRAADYAVCAYRSSLNSGAAMLALSFGVPLVAPETAAFAELLARGAGIGYAPTTARAHRRAGRGDRNRSGRDAEAGPWRLRKSGVRRRPPTLFFEGLTEGLQSGATRLTWVDRLLRGRARPDAGTAPLTQAAHGRMTFRSASRNRSPGCPESRERTRPPKRGAGPIRLLRCRRAARSRPLSRLKHTRKPDRICSCRRGPTASVSRSTSSCRRRPPRRPTFRVVGLRSGRPRGRRPGRVRSLDVGALRRGERSDPPQDPPPARDDQGRSLDGHGLARKTFAASRLAADRRAFDRASA